METNAYLREKGSDHAMGSEVRIPSNAVSAESDIKQPTRALLEDLKLLGTPSETSDADGLGAAFKGPPQSVALIEAGATATAKWWATGLGASVIAAWGSALAWWGDQADNIKVVVIGGASIVTAALAISIGYLIASDVRARAAAAVATINARSALAQAMLRAAETAHDPTQRDGAIQIVPLPAGLDVVNSTEPAANEAGWKAVALQRDANGALKYVVVKGSSEATVPVSQLEFS